MGGDKVNSADLWNYERAQISGKSEGRVSFRMRAYFTVINFIGNDRKPYVHLQMGMDWFFPPSFLLINVPDDIDFRALLGTYGPMISLVKPLEIERLSYICFCEVII